LAQLKKSTKLNNVCYDIRGPVLAHAKKMEEEGHRIIKLNIGNPAAFGFEAPEEIVQDVIRNMGIQIARGFLSLENLSCITRRKKTFQMWMLMM
jgi:aspartate/methionine/tyrosine aminotransferase